MLKFICFIIFFCVAINIFKPAETFAAPLKWKSTVYSHVAHEENLLLLLRDFFSNQGINAVISKNIQGVVSGSFEKLPPSEFFEAITTSFGLVYFYDGNIFYVYTGEEIESRIFELGGINADDFFSTLALLEITDPRYPIKFVKDKGIVMVSGPKRMVELVSETVSALETKVSKKTYTETVKVFPLKYAWADDQTFTFMDKEVVIPGIATILKTLLAGQNTPAQVTGKQEKQLALTLPKLKGTGLAAKGISSRVENNAGANTAKNPENNNSENAGNISTADSLTSVSIQADTRLNAVIIKDIYEKMPFYEELIKALDAPAGLVQIEASIIEIETDSLYQLGIDWRVKTGDSSSNIKTSGGFNADSAFRHDDTSLFTGKGLNFTTILGNAGEYFLARVKALEQNGKARIYSKPQVLTLNNVEALLEHSRTFYVRVQGDEEVDLYNVTAGIALKVTPHIIEEESGKKIKLTVKIDDGSILDEQVDSIPVVSKSSITTQAVINHGESLLIGGYIQRQETESKSGIPYISKLPVVGRAFTTTEKEYINNERVFLITPRIAGNYSDLESAENIKKSEKNDILGQKSKSEVLTSQNNIKSPDIAPSLQPETNIKQSSDDIEKSSELQKEPLVAESKEKTEEKAFIPVLDIVKPVDSEKNIENKNFYTLQIASHKYENDAIQELEKYKVMGFDGIIKAVDLGADKGIWHRIYLGRYESKQEAQEKSMIVASGTGKKPLVVFCKN
jgi:type III secretion protein C